VGLITADEATAAGHGRAGYSKDSYLYTGSYYWTLSPSYFYLYNIHIFANGFSVSSSGNLSDSGVYNNFSVNSGRGGVRPALSLDSGVEVLENGDGTAIHPYVVR